jgi:hypothetical protein
MRVPQKLSSVSSEKLPINPRSSTNVFCRKSCLNSVHLIIIAKLENFVSTSDRLFKAQRFESGLKSSIEERPPSSKRASPLSQELTAEHCSANRLLAAKRRHPCWSAAPAPARPSSASSHHGAPLKVPRHRFPAPPAEHRAPEGHACGFRGKSLASPR